MATKGRVLGIVALRKKLAAIPALARSELQAEMNIAAAEIVALQKALAASNVDSGSLQMSIRMEPFSRGGVGVLIKAGGPLTTRPVRAGQSVMYDYAMANELGTQEMLAQPFFYPAARRKKRAVNRRSAKALRKAVGMAMKK
jgi:HK97 gp10 family phage protein